MSVKTFLSIITSELWETRRPVMAVWEISQLVTVTSSKERTRWE